MSRAFLWPLVASSVSVSLAGCGGSLPHPPYARQPQSALTEIDLAPPPGRVETVPEKPAGADAWVDGEWILRHGRWYWLLGHWVKTPPRARYVPWVVVRASDGTAFYAPSVWTDLKGAPLPQAPAPLAYATASGSAVYDAEGNVDEAGRVIKTAPPKRTENPERPAASVR